MKICLGFVAIVCGSLMLLQSTTTLIRLYRKKSFRFLKIMQWIIIAVSLTMIAQGATILHKKNVDKTKATYYISLAIFEFLLEFGMQTIFWFVTFKYWTTARHLFHLFES